MEQIVRVLKVNDDGTAKVIHTRQSACSGDCHKCSGCGAAKETVILTAYNPIGAKTGDTVVIHSESKGILAAAAVFYMVPLLLFFAGYIVGEKLWQRGGLVSCLAFLSGLVIAKAYNNFIEKRKETIYTITGFRQET